MTQTPSSLFIYLFEQNILPWSEQEILIWNAPYFSEARQFKKFDCYQFFKPYNDEWLENNFSSSYNISEENVYSSVFCIPSKNKEAALYDLSLCLNYLDKGGLLLAIAPNDAGGKRLEKWFQNLGLNPTSLSKSKCRIVWSHKEEVNQEVIQKHIEAGSPQEMVVQEQKFITKPGIFGWNKIDKGSELLAQNLLENLSGLGADFGCGYGYLSKKILDGNKQIKKFYAIDADYNALECCKQNLKRHREQCEIEYHWKDLTKPQELPSLDWIVMNPPFHEGKKIKNCIGQQFIENAAKVLRKNGALYMVANAHLPYEQVLNTHFSTSEKIIEEQGFKVFKAIK